MPDDGRDRIEGRILQLEEALRWRPNPKGDSPPWHEDAWEAGYKLGLQRYRERLQRELDGWYRVLAQREDAE